MNPKIYLIPALALLMACQAPSVAGLSPEESLKTMEVEDGFQIDLFASEPDVVDPVAIAFDESGRVYVAEMREMEVLPALEPGTKATIRRLEDTDHDGKIDQAVLFAEGLSFPSGLAPFKGGVYALCTPDLLYLKDTDGDGKADIKEVVLTGFAQGNAEHRVNNLTWGLDNWIHAANGHGGGKVHRPGDDSKVVDLSGRDFRFNPWTGEFESTSRQLPGGFGLSFDDWGRKYICHNEQHCMHVVLDEYYLSRNPNLSIRSTGEKISADGRVDSQVFPISAPQQWRIDRTNMRAKTMADSFRDTQLKVNGYFTAACGVTPYTGGRFPASHAGNLFACDAAQNLVHRDLLSEKGASMVAQRAEEGTEFLRSSDQWFRPVNLEIGPDGALYVVDFYRDIIETGASIPEDILSTLDMREGSDSGRIYRIVHDSDPSPYDPVVLEGLSQEELVDKLSHPNSWVRKTAQRLFVEDGDSSFTPLLEKAVHEATSPLGRMHALWTLRGMGALSDETILTALADEHPRVREHAIKLAELSLRGSE
ncbi:MAG: dehydrogenase [Candidatus Omnitrophica bacterium]|nr:dehydrogenase [Candidatus Omnitrophota bacterium]